MADSEAREPPSQPLAESPAAAEPPAAAAAAAVESPAEAVAESSTWTPASLQPLAIFNLDFDLSDTRDELIKKIRWIIRLRFVISPAVVVLMFITGWQGLTRQATLTQAALWGTGITGGVALALNGAYFYALRREATNLKLFVIGQLVVDVLIFSSYVHRSGGVTSPFSFLYLLPIIAGAMLVSGRTAVALAALSSLCFVALSVLGATGTIAHVSYFVALDSFASKWPFVALMSLVNPFAFFAVAGLSSFLMRAVRQKSAELAGATESLDRKAGLLAMLFAVSRSAAESRDADSVLDHLGDLLVRGLALDRALIYLREDGEGGVGVSPQASAGQGSAGQAASLVLAREFYADPEATAAPGLRPRQHRARQIRIPLERSAGITALCALQRRPINVTDPASHPDINRELAARIGDNPFAVAPLVFRGEMLGVIGVDRGGHRGDEKGEASVIDDDAFEVLVAFADQAAAALALARLEQGRGRPRQTAPADVVRRPLPQTEGQR